MKKLLLLCIFTAGILYCRAQIFSDNQYRNLGILEKELQQAKTPDEKTNALISLFYYHSRHNDSSNIKAVVDYSDQLEVFTHQTNDPELIARAYLNLTSTNNKEDLKSRIDRLHAFAKLHKLSYYQALAKVRESGYYFAYQPDQNKTNQSLNEAINLTKGLNDSLKTLIYFFAGNSYNEMNSHLQALELAFEANEIATKMHSLNLMARNYGLIGFIYTKLKDYNKSIEYRLRELPLLRMMNKPHLLAVRHANVARDFFFSNQPVLGNYHLQEAYRLADSIQGSKRLYNQITGVTLPGLLNSNYKEILKDFLKKYRRHFFIFPGYQLFDHSLLAEAYEKTGNIDSARHMVSRAGVYLSGNVSAGDRKYYFYVLALVASYDKNWNVAAENYKKSLQIALSQNNLADCIKTNDSLINTLIKQNMFQEASYYYKLGDSLQSELAKQTDKEDITRQEVAALEKEKELQAFEKEKEKNQRHNLQYLGITFGVVALFVSLLVMGIFKVSPRTIKILSFFSFLLFFEFIFLIFKKQIAVITNGEPWMDLAFMVLLAAVMVPLHHWGEHKVVAYLSSKKFSFSALKTSKHRTVSKKQIVNES
ncbi:MAG: hypothetical protein H0W75_02840 [Chitinophagaceae bacterium]|nr:hypothetical protein [Chitinophagaceae bacterium]